KDHPPMAPLLCAGSAIATGPNACPPVAGGEVLYFGADQPRVVGEALLPWSALGLSGPPQDGKLKIEVSASPWFRSRWMSLSGLSPAEGSAHPDRWLPVRLDGYEATR